MLDNVTIKVLSLDPKLFHILVLNEECTMAMVEGIVRELEKTKMKGAILRVKDSSHINVMALDDKQLNDLKKVINNATHK